MHVFMTIFLMSISIDTGSIGVSNDEELYMNSNVELYCKGVFISWDCKY